MKLLGMNNVNGNATRVPTNICAVTWVTDDWLRRELARPNESLSPMKIAAATPRSIDTAAPYKHA